MRRGQRTFRPDNKEDRRVDYRVGHSRYLGLSTGKRFKRTPVAI